jgi:hypothetical protein
MAWFVVASLVSLMLGMVLSNLMQLGAHLGLPLPPADAATGLKTSAFTLKDFIAHMVPKSPIEAMANNEILQVLVFACSSAARSARWAIGRAADQGDRPAGASHAAHHRHRDEPGAAGVCRDGVGHHHQWPGHSRHLRQIHGRLLSGAGLPVGAAGAGRLCLHRQARVPPDCADPRTVPAGVFHRQLGSRLSQAAGGAGPIRRAAQNLQLRHADGVPSIWTAR